MATQDAAPEDHVDLSGCDREPIHVPGSIQPHGVMLVADPATLAVVAGAGEIEALLGIDWLGADLSALLQQDVAALLSLSVAGPGGTVVGAPVAAHDVAFHRSGEWLIAELEPQNPQSTTMIEMLSWLESTSTVFDRATSHQALYDHAVLAFRALTGFDRVMLYRFVDDNAGRVVAEDRDPSLDSFLNHYFPASDIPRQARALYVRNRARVIPDSDYRAAPLRPAGFGDLDLSDVAVRSVSPVHLEYLRNMGVAASASISIVKEGLLWGLIACHHRTPRLMPRDVRIAATGLAGALARQIRAREDALRYRERLALRAGEDALRPALFDTGRPLDVVAERIGDVQRMFAADGFAIVGTGAADHVGVVPDQAALRAFADWFSARDEPLFSTRELGREWPQAALFGGIAGVLAVRLPASRAILLWMRYEQIEEIEWAGNPHKESPLDPAARLNPRTSFEMWKQTVAGRARRWTMEETEAAHRLRHMLREADDAAELRRLNGALERAATEMDAALTQKDLLMREVDHRVQNSLQLVSSFLGIQARDAGPGHVSDQLLEARSRLSAVALVHRRLYRDDEIRTIDLARYLTDLLDDLKASLGPEWGRGMTLDLAPVLIPTDRAVNVGLIAAELVINATKYAYPATGSGPIDVRLEQYQNQLRLTVSDQGIGKVGNREGFGSRMMTAVMKRIDGELHYQDNAPGVRAVVSAPIDGN